ncbi:DUF465 domain-containing protein [Achromobacter sp. GG226]|uniref:DUF465 domain-containing protein n=1 Tax=Verticiella alkaliphila TaxID=2779529 RepID=UPI00353051DB|nr:DUF465 domain-containing protein [Verticiella sp. GG226]
MTPSSLDAVRHRIAVILEEHCDLDVVLRTLAHGPAADDLVVRRLKKRKLKLKDELVRLQMLLVPDIHA